MSQVPRLISRDLIHFNRRVPQLHTFISVKGMKNVCNCGTLRLNNYCNELLVIQYWKTLRIKACIFNDTTPSHVVLVSVSAYSRRAHVRLPRGMRRRRRLRRRRRETSGDVMRPRHPLLLLLLLLMLITPRRHVIKVCNTHRRLL